MYYIFFTYYVSFNHVWCAIWSRMAWHRRPRHLVTRSTSYTSLCKRFIHNTRVNFLPVRGKFVAAGPDVCTSTLSRSPLPHEYHLCFLRVLPTDLFLFFTSGEAGSEFIYNFCCFPVYSIFYFLIVFICGLYSSFRFCIFALFPCSIIVHYAVFPSYPVFTLSFSCFILFCVILDNIPEYKRPRYLRNYHVDEEYPREIDYYPNVKNSLILEKQFNIFIIKFTGLITLLYVLSLSLRCLYTADRISPECAVLSQSLFRDCRGFLFVCRVALYVMFDLFKSGYKYSLTAIDSLGRLYKVFYYYRNRFKKINYSMSSYLAKSVAVSLLYACDLIQGYFFGLLFFGFLLFCEGVSKAGQKEIDPEKKSKLEMEVRSSFFFALKCTFYFCTLIAFFCFTVCFYMLGFIEKDSRVFHLCFHKGHGHFSGVKCLLLVLTVRFFYRLLGKWFSASSCHYSLTVLAIFLGYLIFFIPRFPFCEPYCFPHPITDEKFIYVL